jgi:hypothetical protein
MGRVLVHVQSLKTLGIAIALIQNVARCGSGLSSPSSASLVWATTLMCA